MKVVFDLSSSRIVIEGDAPDLLKILQSARDLAPHVTQIQITANDTGRSPLSAVDAESQRSQRLPAGGTNSTSMTMRQFARSLSLSNAPERIAALAYYANKIEGKPSFSPKDMDGWFTMCGFQKPSQMPVAMFDSKRKYGLMENISRGNWRISNQGENMIIAKIEDRDAGANQG